MKPSERGSRVLEIIAREAAQFIEREAGSGSLITVIRAQRMGNERTHRVGVFVSIFPEDKARTALAFLDRQRETFSDYLKTHTRLRPLPRIDFLLDNREESGAPVVPVVELPKS